MSKYLKNNTAPTTILRKYVFGTKEYSPETKKLGIKPKMATIILNQTFFHNFS
ncbi:hypothetical protein AWH56_26950 [Anaerobacillus isosaccharinicus]|uniref:Uncharacterized protein n=1 Tax=Anaerobacillus isosaccharinicus TaxID=1532552 RepID=A0AC62A4F0_9BACI